MSSWISGSRNARKSSQESQAKLRALVAELTKTEERERRRIAVELHDYLAQSLTATRHESQPRATNSLAGAKTKGAS